MLSTVRRGDTSVLRGRSFKAPTYISTGISQLQALRANKAINETGESHRVLSSICIIRTRSRPCVTGVTELPYNNQYTPDFPVF